MNYKVGYKRRRNSKKWLKILIVTANHPGHAVVVADGKLYEAGIRKPWVVVFVKQVGN